MKCYMRMTASLAFASLVACPAAGFERIEPLEDSSTHGAFRKYTNDKGTVEYDFRYYPDGTAGGYVILPEGDSGEVTICGKTYALKAGLFGRRPGVGMTSIYSKAYTEGSDPLCRDAPRFCGCAQAL